MKQLFSLIFVFLFCALTADAAKATGTPRVVTQPDGSTLVIRTLGDERRHWTQTMDGVMLARVGKAYYIADISADGIITSSGILAHNIDKRSAAESALVKKQNTMPFFKTMNPGIGVTSRAGNSGFPRSKRCPHTGRVRIPVIMVDFQDQPFKLSKDVFANYYNGTEAHEYSTETLYDGYSSVRRFFYDASHGNFDPQFDLYGVYRLKHNHDYYGDKYGRLDEVFSEAISLANQDIDFSQYDSNNDGNVDLLYILYAGTSANNSAYGDEDNDIWPSCSYGLNYRADGKAINIIGVSNELTARAADSPTGKDIRAGIGVMCHEMSHGLGLPDLYWTQAAPIDSHGLEDWNNCGPEDYDLMDGGENIGISIWPATYAAWEKEAMDWITVEELNEPQSVTIYPLNDARGKAYKVVNPSDHREYYMIENLQRTGWNRYLFLSETNRYPGLLVYHINGYNSEANTMTPNNEYLKPRITLLPADGFILASYSISRGDEKKYVWYKGQEQIITQDMFYEEAKGDLYPGLNQVTEILKYNNYNGVDMGDKYPITNICYNSDGSIQFDFMGGTSGINETTATESANTSIYTVEGRYMGTDKSALPHGIYVTNGRKFVK